MKKILLLLFFVLLLGACDKKKLPNGYYSNKNATGTSCIIFQVKDDTLIWKGDYRKPGKAFVYTLTSGKVKGKCITVDENIEKDYEIVGDSIILNKQMFVPFNPDIKKIPEGNYENYMSVPLTTIKLKVFGDSIESKSYKYDELLFTTRNKIILKNNYTAIISYNNDSMRREFPFQPLADGFIIEEVRYVKVD